MTMGAWTYSSTKMRSDLLPMQVKDTVLSRWKQEFLERASEIFEQPKDGQDKDARIAELERMVGRLTMQAEIAKKAVSYASWLRKNSEE